MTNTSFDKIIDKVFDGFKKITPALISIAILSGFVLFLPEFILSELGLNELPRLVISTVGIVFLLSCTLTLTIAGSA